MDKKSLMRKYANLVVKLGVNVQKGQPIRIRTDLDNIEFAHILVEEAYKAGAALVKYDIYDSYVNKLHLNYKTFEELEEVPDFRVEEEKYYHGRNICNISIVSFDPDEMTGVDPKKMSAQSIAVSKKLGSKILNYYSNNEGQWCVVGFPTVKWAKKVFPDLCETEAFDKLFKAILDTCLIDETNDPVDAWYKHNKEIRKHCDQLNDFNFKELHYKNNLGTNLIIRLPKGHIWCGGCEYTNNEKKILFNPNMPTEEVFTTPHRNGVSGIVYASKPLVYNGNIIDKFWLKFVNGEIVDFNAEVGYKYLEALINYDKGTKHLGEVALVPYHSPISLSNILFYETLYDENASCHLAIGHAYETTVKGTEGLNEEELNKMGVNTSFEHVDFMVGTSDLSIVGITYDNEEVEVFRNGDFVI